MDLFSDGTIERFNRAMNDFIESLKQLSDIMGESLEKIASLFPQETAIKNELKTPYKVTRYLMSTISSKPNSKPYSAFKRFYKVQER